MATSTKNRKKPSAKSPRPTNVELGVHELKLLIKEAVREVIVEMATERMQAIQQQSEAEQQICNAIGYGRDFPRA